MKEDTLYKQLDGFLWMLKDDKGKEKSNYVQDSYVAAYIIEELNDFYRLDLIKNITLKSKAEKERDVIMSWLIRFVIFFTGISIGILIEL